MSGKIETNPRSGFNAKTIKPSFISVHFVSKRTSNVYLDVVQLSTDAVF